MHEELALLYQQDQADRSQWQTLTPEQQKSVGQRDKKRLQRVEELLANGALQDAKDYFHAAMVFQHGGTGEHYWQAHELAKRGAQLGHVASRWLTAAAYDRWLMSQGKPQKYGTQYTTRDGRWLLYEVDPATTDEQRAEWNVPSLARALQRAEKMNRT
jgi:hypothetical protein